MQRLKKAVNTVVNVLFVAAVVAMVLVTLMAVASRFGGDGKMLVGGYGFGRVVTGSMEPTIATGSFVLMQEVDPASLQVGDVITFWSEDPDVPAGVPVTHAIERVEADGSFITKGEANPEADPYAVEPEQIIGLVVWNSPLIGSLIGIAQSTYIYPVMIAVLAVLIVLNFITVVKEAKKWQQDESSDNKE